MIRSASLAWSASSQPSISARIAASGAAVRTAASMVVPLLFRLTDRLISTHLGHVNDRGASARDHPSRSRHLLLPARPAGGARGGTALRRGVAAAGSDQRPVLPADVA